MCRGQVTRYDVAKEIVKACELENEVEMGSVDSRFFQTELWGHGRIAGCRRARGLNPRAQYQIRDKPGQSVSTSWSGAMVGRAARAVDGASSFKRSRVEIIASSACPTRQVLRTGRISRSRAIRF